MFGPWLNRRWLCFPSVHLEEWVIILPPHFRQTDGFSFGKLVYIRFFYYCSWRFFNSHSFECKTFVDCRENFTLGARGLFFLFLLFLSDAKRRGKKKTLWSHEPSTSFPCRFRIMYLIKLQKWHLIARDATMHVARFIRGRELRQGYTLRLFSRRLTRPFCQCLGHVSSDAKSLCLFH